MIDNSKVIVRVRGSLQPLRRRVKANGLDDSLPFLEPAVLLISRQTSGVNDSQQCMWDFMFVIYFWCTCGQTLKTVNKTRYRLHSTTLLRNLLAPLLSVLDQCFERIEAMPTKRLRNRVHHQLPSKCTRATHTAFEARATVHSAIFS